MRTSSGHLARSALLAVTIISLLGAPAHADGEAKLLAPTGTLRVGIYPGSPTSMVTDAAGTSHGLAYDLGGKLAKRLGVPIDYVRFQRVAGIVTAIHDGQVDFTVTNATPARANEVSFSQPVLAIELGFLVPANSPNRQGRGYRQARREDRRHQRLDLRAHAAGEIQERDHRCR
ncbi:transporter substrate-binding domain-containing protein [Bradyrhizobium sp. LM2.9]